MAQVDKMDGSGAGGARPCPICSRPSDPAYRPFCCKRCADVDLARWLGGRYAIPAAETDEGDGDTPPAYDVED